MKKLLMTVAALGFASQALAASVTLNWTNQTTRTDGSNITGTITTQIWDSSGSPPFNVQIGTGPSPFTTGQLQAGVHSFTVIECEGGGACSAASNIATVTVAPVAPKAITNLTATVGP